MGDEHGGDAGLLLDAADLLPGLEPQPGIQVGKGLVQQQHPGHFHQGPGNGHPLLLTAGELTGLALHQSVDLHQLCRIQNPASHFLLAEFLLAFQIFQREADVLLHRQVGVQGVVLEHQTHPPLLRRQVGHVLVAEENLPGGGLLQAGDHIKGGAFAAARGPQQADELAVGNLKIEFVDRYRVRRALFPAGENFRQVLQ